jgi:lipid II isoglutaminyl synthase (glutamine-hydrolysing)
VTAGRPRIRLAHLFPAQLNLYGDTGNVAALTRRAAWRNIDTEVVPVSRSEDGLPPDTNVIFIGGGPDRAQAAIAAELDRLAPQIRRCVDSGAALLAVCGGYQNLGRFYKSQLAGLLAGPAIFGAWTEAPEGAPRLSGGCIVTLSPTSPIAAAGRESARRAGLAGEELSVVGFENHSGRTWLDDSSTSLGHVAHGHGNNAHDGSEGFLALPGPNGRPGLRLGTYLHGPLLPRNPHLADFILLCALAGQGIAELSPLDDRDEWAAHRAFAARWITNP